MEQSSKILKNGIRKRPIPNQGLSDYNNGATERRFSPYSDNGGSVVAIAGEDFCVIASDTRLSQFAKLICLKLRNVFVSDCKMYLLLSLGRIYVLLSLTPGCLGTATLSSQESSQSCSSFPRRQFSAPLDAGATSSPFARSASFNSGGNFES